MVSRTLPRFTALIALSLLGALAGCVGNAAWPQAAQTGGSTGTPAAAVGTRALQTFSEQVWTGLLGPRCYGCHHAGAIAQQLGSGFVFVDKNSAGALTTNYAIARGMAALDSNLFLRKLSGQVAHYGGSVVDPNSADYATLAAFVQSSRQAVDATVTVPAAASLQAQAVLPSPAMQLRKAAMVLANRLPSASEKAAVQADPVKGLAAGIDAFLAESNFYDRLGEAYNDMLLVDSYARTGTAADLFIDVPNIDWYTRVSWKSDADRTRAIAGTQRALAHQALDLVRYVARHDLPFTDILTASYTVVNPYSACALGVAGDVVFKTPVTCSAAETGTYDETDLQQLPVAQSPAHTVGLLTTRAFLMRHPTTPTNRNRHRFNQVSANFLGFDVRSAVPVAAPQTSAAGEAAPTMTNRNCTDCHAMVDPGAGMFQDWDASGMYAPQAWHSDMFGPGYFGKPAPAGTPDLLAYLATQMVQDPRFARQTTRVIYETLTGHAASLDPPLPGDPNYATSFAGYLLLQQALDGWTQTFVASQYSVKALVKAMATSPWFQLVDVQPSADATSAQILGSTFVHARLLTPESLNRNLAGMLGLTWLNAAGQPALVGDYYMFYGGIDSDAVTVRDASFTSFKSNITLRMANELACTRVPLALSNDTGAQATTLRANLLPGMPAGGAASLTDAQRKAIMTAMRASMLGEEADPDGPEVAAMLTLYQDAQAAVVKAGTFDLPAPCQQGGLSRDTSGATQAWMAVAAYIFSDEKFLFE